MISPLPESRKAHTLVLQQEKQADVASRRDPHIGHYAMLTHMNQTTHDAQTSAFRRKYPFKKATLSALIVIEMVMLLIVVFIRMTFQLATNYMAKMCSQRNWLRTTSMPICWNQPKGQLPLLLII